MNLFKRIFVILVLAYLAVLPIAGTIALRNLLLLLILTQLAYALMTRPSWFAVAGREFSLAAFAPVLMWALFLILFPLWASEPQVAWENLRGQWGLSILAGAIGVGAAFLLGSRGPTLMQLSGASMALVCIHLALAFIAWAGLLGANPPTVMEIPQMWRKVVDVVDPGSETRWAWQAFPWGFQGFDPMHGNLGYAASQTVALLAAVFFVGLGRPEEAQTFKQAALGLALCLFSVAMANSRGAILFIVLTLVVAAGVYWVKSREGWNPPGRTKSALGMNGGIAIGLALALMLTLALALKLDPRWRILTDKIHVAAMVENPLDFLCNGLSSQEEIGIRERLKDRKTEEVDLLIYSLNGDGGRFLLMRAGMELVTQHPLGLDGSRHSFRKLMLERCGHVPKFDFAHLHQGWMDTLLALGWLGGGLLASLFVYFMLVGIRALGDPAARAWGFGLFLLSVFWLIRGLTDSVYREHLLQMQAFVLCYLFSRIHLMQREKLAEKGAALIRVRC